MLIGVVSACRPRFPGAALPDNPGHPISVTAAQWLDGQIEMQPVASLVHYARNARHSHISDSLRRSLPDGVQGKTAIDYIGLCHSVFTSRELSAGERAAILDAIEADGTRIIGFTVEFHRDDA